MAQGGHLERARAGQEAAQSQGWFGIQPRTVSVSAAGDGMMQEPLPPYGELTAQGCPQYKAQALLWV